LAAMKHWLLRQPEVRAAGMSGSGSTFFALLREAASGGLLEQRVKTMFGETLWTAFCTASA
jgi:4-diphosphocytidyl-2C-methyl-D-erythritol kinase